MPTTVEARLRPHIVVVGAMGVGKTTVGEMLAEELGWPFLDSDAYLEAKTGDSGNDIAAREGVKRLHELELEVFLLMCDTPVQAVLAPAASVVDHETGRVALDKNVAVWLTAPNHVLVGRQSAGTHRRPISAAELAGLHRKRAPWLKKVCDFTVDTGVSSPQQVVEKVVSLLPVGIGPSESG
jgi:shikimate kinase